MNIYVSNLSYSTKEDSLEELFAAYGEVTSANIITDKMTGRSRGFGFVEMSNDAEGQRAIDELNESQFEGKTITVNVARPKTERSDRGGFGRGGDNRGGGYGRGNDSRGGGYGRGGDSRGGYGRSNDSRGSGFSRGGGRGR